MILSLFGSSRLRCTSPAPPQLKGILPHLSGTTWWATARNSYTAAVLSKADKLSRGKQICLALITAIILERRGDFKKNRHLR